MNKPYIRSIFGNFFFAIIVALTSVYVVGFTLTFSGCTRTVEASTMATGVVIQNPGDESHLGGFVGDVGYAVVKASSLPAYYAQFHADLFSQGITEWSTKFDCNHFAAYYVAKAQIKYAHDNFQSFTKAQTLALGEFWYTPDGSTSGHAIVVAWTDEGLLFIEPQTGELKKLSNNEVVSRIMVKW